MFVIDGSSGEGGGQILRTTLALSALTNTGVRVTNIRAKRPNPGLQMQHIAAVRAVQELTEATVDGAELGSSTIEFKPGPIRARKFAAAVGTAGSVTLILQAVIPVALGARRASEMTLTGGTDVRWSPPFAYLANVHLKILKQFGFSGDALLLKRGFYPKGGGKVKLVVGSGRLSPIVLSERGAVVHIQGISFAEERLKPAAVAERQAGAARDVLRETFPSVPTEIGVEYGKSASLGSGIVVWAATTESRVGADTLGEKGKRAERVGRQAAQELVAEIESGACLDKYMADQIVPYLAVAGGRATISSVTQHTLTNIDVVNTFGFDVTLKNSTIVSAGERIV